VPSGERHARFTRHEHQLGEWIRVRRSPDVRLSGLLDRELQGFPAIRYRTYGSREYSARDCEGNLWSFGTYDPYAG
jgi:hypothetical protein